MANIIALGDSYVAGYGVAPSECWVSLLESKLERPIINSGANGAWITEIANNLPEIAPGEIVLALGGCNDLLGGASVETLQRAVAAIRRYVDSRRARFLYIVPPVPVIVNEEPFVGISLLDSLREKAIEWDHIAQGLHLEAVLEGSDDLFFDGIHLVPEGHERIADAVYAGGNDRKFW